MTGTVSRVLELAYRAPFDFVGLLDWYRVRAVPAVERVSSDSYERALALSRGTGVVTVRDGSGCLRVELDLDDERDAEGAAGVVHRMFDLDTNPEPVTECLCAVDGLAPMVQQNPGLRLPGTATAFEALMRALTGQQVSVGRGRGLLENWVGKPEDRLRPFPTGAQLLDAGTEWFAGPAARRRAIIEAAQFDAEGGLSPDADLSEVARNLLAIKGIGPWTVAYTLMRGYGAPDVDLGGDRALAVALEKLGYDGSVSQFLAPAAPWRSYAAMHLWRA